MNFACPCPSIGSMGPVPEMLTTLEGGDALLVTQRPPGNAAVPGTAPPPRVTRDPFDVSSSKWQLKARYLGEDVEVILQPPCIFHQ